MISVQIDTKVACLVNEIPKSKNDSRQLLFYKNKDIETSDPLEKYDSAIAGEINRINYMMDAGVLLHF